jgi:hypothetical protein
MATSHASNLAAPNLAALACAVLFLGACATQPPSAPVMDRTKSGALGSSIHDTPTQHNDAARSGAYLHETVLSPDSVNPKGGGKGKFERLFDWEVDGQVYTQPLYVSQVPHPQKGLINIVVVATTNNSVYAFEAPAAGSDVQPNEGVPLWQVGSDQLGAPLPYDFFLIDWGVLGHNMKPQIGITATPVIDRQRGLVYLTVKTGTSGFLGIGSTAKYRLFALDLLGGQIVASVEVSATHDGPDGQTRFDAKHHLQRPGLLEANDRIYLAFGSHQDTLPYHGWVLAYDADTLEALAAYCTTCDHPGSGDDCSPSCEGGIWQAGAGPASDQQGNIYVMTGNGSYNRDKGATDRGLSFIKLDKDLNVLGSWTPAEYECLNRTGADLGSAGPTYVGPQSVLIGGGKEGLLYALETDTLQGPVVQPGRPGKRDPCQATDKIPDPGGKGSGYWSIQATPSWKEDSIMDYLRVISDTVAGEGYHHIHGSPVQWTVQSPHDGEQLLLYVSGERDVLRAFEFNRDGFAGAALPGEAPKDTFHSRCANSNNGMPGGFLTVSANERDPKSGIVWAAMPRRNRDALNHTVRGVLRAYQAYPDDGSTELKEIWNSDNGVSVARSSGCADLPPTEADPLGDFAKFVPPTVAEGKVYVSTFSERLAVYGIAQPVFEARVAGRAARYDAQLRVDMVPTMAEPGQTFPVSITATNTGSSTWRVEDDIRLGSRTIPKGMATPEGGPDALKVQSAVQPGETYTFNFRLRARQEEESRDFSWRMLRIGGDPKPKQPTGEWFGQPSPELAIDSFKADCSGLRDRARALHLQAKAARARLQGSPSETDRNDAAALKDKIQALKQDAASRKCSLRAGIDAEMDHRPGSH